MRAYVIETIANISQVPTNPNALTEYPPNISPKNAEKWKKFSNPETELLSSPILSIY